MTPNEPNPTDGIPRKHVSRVEQQKKLTQACRDANLAMGPRFVAQIVYTFADARVGEAWPSISLIAHEAGCDPDTASAHVRALQRAGILWTILPPRRASKSGVAPEPLRALVAFAPGPDGRARPVKNGGEYPAVPPDGRALFLVRPCASQLAAVRWETDARVIRQWTTERAIAERTGKRLNVDAQPAPTSHVVNVGASPANTTSAREVEPTSAPQPSPTTGGNRYERLRAALAHTDLIDLSGSRIMREQCAAYLDDRELADRLIDTLANPSNVSVWFRKSLWPKGRPERVTLTILAGNYDIRNGERIYTWAPLGRIIDAVKADLAATKREAEERRRQAEREAEYQRKLAEEHEQRVKLAEEARAKYRAKYPDLDVDTSQGFATAENREFTAMYAAARARAQAAPVVEKARGFRLDAPTPVLPSEAPTRAAGSPRGYSTEDPAPVAKAR